MLYTVKEAAQIMGYNPKKILRLIKNYKLDAIQIGRQWRIFDEYIDNNTKNKYFVAKDKVQ